MIISSGSGGLGGGGGTFDGALYADELQDDDEGDCFSPTSISCFIDLILVEWPFLLLKVSALLIVFFRNRLFVFFSAHAGEYAELPTSARTLAFTISRFSSSMAILEMVEEKFRCCSKK